MNLFNSIKVDKLKWFYPKQIIPESDRCNIDKRIKKYFSDCTASNKMGNVFYRFTPTKLIGSGRDNYKHNLEMPEQEVFLNALQDITLNNPSIQENLRVTEIHLTKDIILNSKVNDYILELSNRHYSRLEVELIESDGWEYTLKLHGYHNLDSDNMIKFTIKFYNKSEEYYKRHNTYICKLNQPLSPEDRIQVKCAYNPEDNTLDLSKMNCLRVEMEFHRTEKIKSITKELSDEDDFLSVKLLIERLKDGSLYQKLDNVFNKTVEKYIFNKKDNTVNKGNSLVGQLACEILSESSDFYYLRTVAKELGLEEEFSKISSGIKNKNSELLEELKEKLLKTTQNLKNKHLARNNGNYLNRILSPTNLIYDIPILDDS